MAKIFVVATPIGNLEDITLRALRTLKEADLILAEDTRTTQKLLNRYDIKTPTLSYHQYSNLKKSDYIIELLKNGKKLALVSDAGTPGISDPGNKLIEIISKRVEEAEIIPVPGANALAVAASISGFPMERFLFLGFPPAKKKRKKFFDEVVKSKYPIIFYESPYRILKTLNELNSLYAKYNIQNTRVVICRELTKKFETVYRGNVPETIDLIKKDKVRGEFVVIIKNS